jgi:chromosome segregation ATPase
MDSAEEKHLKKNLEAALEDLDRSKKENEELRLKNDGSQILIKRLRKDLKDCSTSDLGQMVKKINEENKSLKDKLEDLEEQLTDNQNTIEDKIKESNQLEDELLQANMKVLELENMKKKLESELTEAKDKIDKLHTSSDLIQSQFNA